MNGGLIGKLSTLTLCTFNSAMILYLIWTGCMMGGCFVWRLPAWLCFLPVAHRLFSGGGGGLPAGGGWVVLFSGIIGFYGIYRFGN